MSFVNERLQLVLVRSLFFATRGLFAGLLLSLLDLSCFRSAIAAQFPSPFLQQRLALHVLALSMLTLIPFGLAAGWLWRLSRWLQEHQRRAVGLLWAGVMAPLVGWVAFSLFLGGKMQRVPLHSLWSGLIFVLSLILIARLAPLMLAGWTRLQASSAMKRWLVALGLAVVLLGLHLADRQVLPRLYPWFHGVLLVLQLAMAGLIVSLPASMWPKQKHWCIGLAVCCGLVVWQGTRSLDKLRRAMTMRSVVREHSLLTGRLLQLLPKRAGVTPRTTAIVEKTEQAPTYRGPRLTGRDVFLITVDAFRHDKLSPNIAPKMHSLAAHGVQFSRAYTQVPHTSFAVATLLTGKPVYALMKLGHDAGSHKTLPLILRNYRYKTAAFYPPSVFFVERDRLQALEDSAYGFEYVKVEYLSGERRTQQVIDFLDAERPERVFAWIHYLEPHEPYDPHPGGPDRSRPDTERYDGEVRYVDQQVARLTEYLLRTRPGALLLFAADHGEEFGEHGGRYHGTTLYDEQARVPLFLFDTSSQPLLGPQIYPQPVGLIDVAPTLLGLLDVEPPLQMRGQNLAPWLLLRRETLPQRAIWSEIGKRKMIVYGDHKLICDLGDDSCQVFDLVRDPQEQINLADSDPRRTMELRGRLLSLLSEAREYEQAAQGTSVESKSSLQHQAVLARARLGDRAALPLLLPLLSDPSASEQTQHEAIRLAAILTTQAIPIAASDADPLAALSDDVVARATKSLSAQLLTNRMQEQKRWIAILLTRLGLESEPISGLLHDTLSDEKATPTQRLAAALAQWRIPSCRSSAKEVCVRDSLQVLDAAMSLDDPDQIRPLLRLLGESHDGRALAPLLRQLDSVRSRVDVVAALGQLGDQQALPRLGQTLLADPYVHVRAQAARSIHKIGGPSAQQFLTQAEKTETEPAILSVLANLSQTSHPPSSRPDAGVSP